MWGTIIIVCGLKIAPPIIVGAWSMAVLLWQCFECLLLLNVHLITSILHHCDHVHLTIWETDKKGTFTSMGGACLNPTPPPPNPPTRPPGNGLDDSTLSTYSMKSNTHFPCYMRIYMVYAEEVRQHHMIAHRPANYIMWHGSDAASVVWCLL